MNNVSVESIIPSAGHLLIEPIEPKKQTASGIYLPDNHEEVSHYGTVKAIGKEVFVGSGTRLSATCIKGDLLIYKHWKATEIEINNKKYAFVHFEDVLGKVQE